MTFADNAKKLDKEDLGAIKTFLAHIFFILQDFVRENRDNEPLEDWDYDKVIRIVSSGALDK